MSRRPTATPSVAPSPIAPTAPKKPAVVAPSVIRPAAPPAQPPTQGAPSPDPQPQPQQPEQSNSAKQPFNYLDYLQDFFKQANAPFDYAAQAQNAKSAYESVFGNPETQSKESIDATKRTFELDKARALEDIRGNYATRGLHFSGDLDKALAESGIDFASAEAKALADIRAPYEERQSDSIFQLIGDAAKARETARSNALSIIPNLMKASQKDYPAGSIGEYEYYVDQEKAAGRAPLSFSEYQTADANRKRPVTNISMGANGMTSGQTQNFLTISNKYQADPIIATGTKGATAIAIANQVIANPGNAANQLKSLYTLVKNLDPDSAVREGELQLAQQTQSYFDRFTTALTRVQKGQIISPDAAVALATATKELASAWFEAARRRDTQYQSQANVAGLGDPFKQYLGGFDRPYSTAGDPASELEDDIRQLGSNYPTREALIAALETAYPEFKKGQIAAKVYSLIPDKK